MQAEKRDGLKTAEKTEPVRISIIPYLNTLPFRYGLQHCPPGFTFNLSYHSPADCARMLQAKKADIGLLPAAAIPEIPGLSIIPGYCIASSGAAETVCIFSQKPIGSIRKILLDYNSRSSAALAGILCREYWKTGAVLETGPPGYEEQITGETAGLIIGNRSFQYKHRFAYSYDLGEAWRRMTGLPFVFAVWASVKPLSATYVSAFNKSMEYGVSHTREAIISNRSEGADLNESDFVRYLTNTIHYRLDGKNMSGLRRFLEYLHASLEKTGYSFTLR